MASGFYKAPGSKAYLFVFSTASLGLSFLISRSPASASGSVTTNAGGVEQLLLQSSTGNILMIAFGGLFYKAVQQLAFSSLGELIFGSGLIYSLRHVERRMGSARYLSFTVLSSAISFLMQQVLIALLPDLAPLSNGPYGVIFSLMVYYFAHIPRLQVFKLGVEFSDKSVLYLVAAQLMFNRGVSSFIPALFGIIAGVLCLSEFLPLHKFRFPSQVESFCQTVIMPLLKSSSPLEQASEENRFIGGFGTPNMNANNNNNNNNTNNSENIGQPSPGLRPNSSVYRREQLTGGGGGYINPFQFQGLGQPAIPTPAVRPLVPPPSEEAIESLTALGFERQAVINALRRHENNTERAANDLLSR